MLSTYFATVIHVVMLKLDSWKVSLRMRVSPNFVLVQLSSQHTLCIYCLHNLADFVTRRDTKNVSLPQVLTTVMTHSIITSSLSIISSHGVRGRAPSASSWRLCVLASRRTPTWPHRRRSILSCGSRNTLRSPTTKKSLSIPDVGKTVKMLRCLISRLDIDNLFQSKKKV